MNGVTMNYIAFIRGINVGGKNKLKMSDLQALCASLGLADVKTFIQSGNVLFRSDESEEELIERLEKALLQTFLISVKVLLRTTDELKTAIVNCPFPEDEITKAQVENTVGESLYYHLLNTPPSADLIYELNKRVSDTERYAFYGRTVYLLLKCSIRHSKLSSALDRHSEGTTRNRNSISKLALAEI